MSFFHKLHPEGLAPFEGKSEDSENFLTEQEQASKKTFNDHADLPEQLENISLETEEWESPSCSLRGSIFGILNDGIHDSCKYRQPNSTCFFQEMFDQVMNHQEKQESKCLEMKGKIHTLQKQMDDYDNNISELITDYELKLENLKTFHRREIENMTREHEDLIRDLLSGHEVLFDTMKIEFLQDVEKDPGLKTKSGLKIWSKFNNLSENMKGTIVVGICIISTALGSWASWGFLVWAWPKLLSFAVGISGTVVNLAGWAAFLAEIIQSRPFQNFLKAWEDGQPLDVCLQQFLQTAEMSSMLKMAPKILSKVKMLTCPV